MPINVRFLYVESNNRAHILHSERIVDSKRLLRLGVVINGELGETARTVKSTSVRISRSSSYVIDKTTPSALMNILQEAVKRVQDNYLY